MVVQNKRISIILLVVALILLAPLIAMQFTNEVNWTFLDFAVAAGLLLGTALICEMALRKIKKTKNRIAICIILFLALLLIWAELAVGVFGTVFTGQ